MGWSIYWLLIAMPIAAVLRAMGAAAPLLFFCAALAIVPLAVLIVHATEHLAARTGPALGGLLNATFGNLPELIISMVALRAGLLDMVRASLIGALLANLLLALGVAFLLGGLRHHVQEYNPTGARSYASMMMLAAYALYLVFMLRTHPEVFAGTQPDDADHGPRWSVTRALATLVLASLG